MRFLLAVSVLCFGAQAGTVAYAAEIAWHAKRPLTWEDFQGPVPSGIDDKRVAATAASISWSYSYEIGWSSDECAFAIATLQSAASFSPEKSWVRSGHRTTAILEHEQIHFDIAQIYTEMFSSATRELVGTSRPCEGRNERRATRYVEREIARLVGSVYEDVWRQFQNRQEMYDSETRHGIDARAQARWTSEITAQLKAAGNR